jgi:hypothetical protein
LDYDGLVFSGARGQLTSFEGTVQSATLMQFHPSQNDFPRGCRATNSNRAGVWARIQFPGDPSLQYGPVDLDLGTFERDTLIGHEMAIFHRADLNAENSTRYSKDLGCEAFQVISSSGQAPYTLNSEPTQKGWSCRTFSIRQVTMTRKRSDGEDLESHNRVVGVDVLVVPNHCFAHQIFYPQQQHYLDYGLRCYYDNVPEEVAPLFEYFYPVLVEDLTPFNHTKLY